MEAQAEPNNKKEYIFTTNIAAMTPEDYKESF